MSNLNEANSSVDMKINIYSLNGKILSVGYLANIISFKNIQVAIKSKLVSVWRVIDFVVTSINTWATYIVNQLI